MQTVLQLFHLDSNLAWLAILVRVEAGKDMALGQQARAQDTAGAVHVYIAYQELEAYPRQHEPGGRGIRRIAYRDPGRGRREQQQQHISKAKVQEIRHHQASLWRLHPLLGHLLVRPRLQCRTTVLLALLQQQYRTKAPRQHRRRAESATGAFQKASHHSYRDQTCLGVSKFGKTLLVWRIQWFVVVQYLLSSHFVGYTGDSEGKLWNRASSSACGHCCCCCCVSLVKNNSSCILLLLLKSLHFYSNTIIITLHTWTNCSLIGI